MPADVVEVNKVSQAQRHYHLLTGPLYVAAK